MPEKKHLPEFIKFALKVLALKDCFKDEMKQKLKFKGATSEEIEKVIEYLNKFNYLNDESLLHKYVDEIASKGKGINYLKQKLHDKGCDELLTLYNLDSFYPPEQETAAAMKVVSKIKDSSIEKIAQKLASKGFSSSVALAVAKRERNRNVQ